MNTLKKFVGAIIIAVLSSLCTIWGLCAAFNIKADTVKGLVRFLAVKSYIEKTYVEPADDKVLLDGAINGLVNALGDKHSVYLDEKRYKKLKEHTNSTFGGIGVVMGFREKKVIILSVMEGTPGEKAALKQNDEIVAVDGTPVADYAPEEVAAHIRGEVGTKVRLTIRREGSEDWEAELTRDNIHVKTAGGRMLGDGIGYIRIASFGESTDKEFANVLRKLRAEKMRGLVIDLRGNPGGLLTTCVKIAQKLVPQGKIVSIVYRDGRKEVYKSKLNAPPVPLAVLIDENSASASEILAGALQDAKAAAIVGQKSYGKGSVQAVRQIPGGEDALKLTVAKYYTRNGTSIDGKGIVPDYEIALDTVETADGKADRALDAAKEILKNPAPPNAGEKL